MGEKKWGETSVVGSLPTWHLVPDLALVNINYSLERRSWWASNLLAEPHPCLDTHTSMEVSAFFSHIHWLSSLSLIFLQHISSGFVSEAADVWSRIIVVISGAHVSIGVKKSLLLGTLTAQGPVKNCCCQAVHNHQPVLLSPLTPFFIYLSLKYAYFLNHEVTTIAQTTHQPCTLWLFLLFLSPAWLGEHPCLSPTSQGITQKVVGVLMEASNCWKWSVNCEVLKSWHLAVHQYISKHPQEGEIIFYPWFT